jgi:hypothetical protein
VPKSASTTIRSILSGLEKFGYPRTVR